MMPSYTYEPLDRLKREFRLARLHPRAQGQADSQTTTTDTQTPAINLSVIKSSLDEDIKYTALSYVWGDANDTSTIMIDGHPFAATKNLVAALEQLRDDSEQVTLWVDAICIQQSDSHEKSWQIQLMKEIYEKATRTIVWLGVDADGADEFMNAAIVTGLADLLRQWDSSMAQNPIFFSTIREQRSFLQTPLFASGQTVLKKLLNREYWFRAWCLQEFCVSQDIMVACGGWSIDLAAFKNIVDVFTQVGSKSWYDLLSTHDLLTANDMNPAAFNGEGVAGVIHGATRMFEQRQRFGAPQGQGQSLADLLIYAFSLSEADVTLRSTDPRDRVFALLNLASDAKELGIHPDYDKSCEDVFIETWSAILAKGQADLLAYSQYGHPHGRLGSSTRLPSWVPDWRVPREEALGNEAIDRPFKACGDMTSTEWAPTNNVRMIAPRGVKVDTVAKVGTSLGLMENYLTNGFGPFAKFIFDITSFVTESSTTHAEAAVYDAQAAEEAIWRIPVKDREAISATNQEFQRLTPVSAERFMSVFTVMAAFSDTMASENPAGAMPGFAATVLENMGKFDLYMVIVMRNRGSKPFLTSRGYVGLGPAAMEDGDLVVILYGSHVPFVLRPRDGDKYQLLGEAYVHGIMDGEFMQVEREKTTFYII
ncbi:hypothetical protein ACHAPT_008128 [Fusarium lateritium]